MPSLPLPPVPQGLRELLKEYPEHIQILQNDLIEVASKKSPTPPFERAVWALEDALSAFISEARQELKAAQATGDAEAIERAGAKERLMSKARSANGGMSNIADLLAYFEQTRGR